MAKPKVTIKRGTCVISCTCAHTYQDKVYGKGRRLANVTSQSKSRCTVCGKEK